MLPPLEPQFKSLLETMGPTLKRRLKRRSTAQHTAKTAQERLACQNRKFYVAADGERTICAAEGNCESLLAMLCNRHVDHTFVFLLKAK